jgi:nitronate monooxygenase
MGGVSTAELVTAVTSSGGFAFLGAGTSINPIAKIGAPHPCINNCAATASSENLKAEMRSIRDSLKLPADGPIPIGIGFLGWVLDKTEVSDDPRIPRVLEQMPMAIWFAFGENMGKYVAQVRAFDAKRTHKTIVFVLVNTLAEAEVAVNEWKVDVLVAQGVFFWLHLHCYGF